MHNPYARIACLIWLVVGLEQLYVWHYNFPGDKSHLEFWRDRQGLPLAVFKNLGLAALLSAFLYWKESLTGMLWGLIPPWFFIGGPIYNYWLPAFFKWGFWYNGMVWAGATVKPVYDLASITEVWNKEMGSNAHIVPAMPGNPIFIDNDHIIITAMTLAGYWFSYKAIAWARNQRHSKRK